eukprot:417332_1
MSSIPWPGAGPNLDWKGSKLNFANLMRFLDKKPKLPFKLRRNPEADVTELVRTSCERLSESAKYVGINHDFLEEYAEDLPWQEMNEYQTHCDRFGFNLNENELSERDMINLSCFSVILAFRSTEDQRDLIQTGVHNMFKKYPKLDVTSLNGITVHEVAEFFDRKMLQSVCEVLTQYIHEIMRVLLIKRLNDFADFVYNIIDMAWIKSQTKKLSAIETIQWELNDKHELGLTLAPTQSEIIRRCVVIDYKPSDDDPNNAQNNAICKRLVEQRAFIYAINDQVVYNLPFEDIIAKIRHVVTATKADPLCPFETNGVVALQFGLHLENEPNTTQSLLFNFVNDFSPLNDQYLYRSLFGANKDLRIYLYQRAQAVVLELYYNLYANAPKGRADAIFNFSDISRLTAVLDSAFPFVLLNEGLIQMKEELKDESDEPREADVLVEMQVCALWAIELLVEEGSKHSVNAAEIAYYLRSQASRSSGFRNKSIQTDQSD